MSARHHHQFVIDATLSHIVQYLAREFRQEGRIVAGIEEERSLVHRVERRETLHVVNRADAVPCPPQTLEVDPALNTLTNVTCRQARPYDIGYIRGTVIEHVDADTRVVGSGEKRIAGAETRAHNSQVSVAALLQPVVAGPHVDHRLP